MADHYADGTCQWWHLPQPPPELVAALGDGWLPGGGRVLDIGCGLGTETGYLASAGRQAAGELRRVLRPGGKLLPRASLRVGGVRNDGDRRRVRRLAGGAPGTGRGAGRYAHARGHHGPLVGVRVRLRTLIVRDRGYGAGHGYRTLSQCGSRLS